MADHLPPDPSLFLGRVGRYWRGQALGSGSTGTVWVGWHPGLGIPVAIKQLSPPLVASAGFLARFRAEAKALGGVAHPNVVAIYDYLEVDGAAFLVMELVAGPSLRALLAAHGRLSPEHALGAMAGALRGLGHIHELGVIHRDVKPDNILVDTAGVSKLVDFGLAASAGVAAGAPIGTPAYISPEAVRGDRLDARSDLYSAGVVLFELLAGRVPFAAGDIASLLALHLYAQPPPLSGVPAHLAGLCDAALAKDPAGRPHSAAEMLAQLEAAATEGFGPNWAARSSLAGPVAAVAAGVELAGGGTAATAAAVAGGSEIATANITGAGGAAADGLAGSAGKRAAARRSDLKVEKGKRSAYAGPNPLRVITRHPIRTSIGVGLMVLGALGVVIARMPPPPLLPVPVAMIAPLPGASAPPAVYALVSGTATSDSTVTLSGDCTGGMGTQHQTTTIGPSVARYDEGARSFVTNNVAVSLVGIHPAGPAAVCRGSIDPRDTNTLAQALSDSGTASLAADSISTRLDFNVAAAGPETLPAGFSLTRGPVFANSFSGAGQPDLLPDCPGPTSAPPRGSPGGQRPPGSTICTPRSSSPTTVTMNALPPPNRCRAKASNGLRVSASCTFTEVLTLSIVVYLAPQPEVTPPQGPQGPPPTSTTIAGSGSTTNGSQP